MQTIGTIIATLAIPHPALTAADTAGMTRSELAFFTDSPMAHVTAYEDFQRDLRIEQRNRAAARAFLARGAR